MSSRRTARRGRFIRSTTVETLADYDPALHALDEQLLAAGWKRPTFAIVRRRHDGKISGRVVWRRAGESIAWTARFTYEGAQSV